MSARTLRSLCDDKAFKFGHFVVEFATPGIGEHLLQRGASFAVRAAVIAQVGFDRTAGNQPNVHGFSLYGACGQPYQ